jgi:uncharacterized protein YoxC
MAKVTVFQGTVNGRNFDNVADYNAAITTLIEAGETDIQATSSTTIKNIEDPVEAGDYTTTCTNDCCPGGCNCTCCEDEDLSYFPYMEEDDPFYLDLLATDDPVVNQEAYAEAQKVLEKCYRHITKTLNDPTIPTEKKEQYLLDIQDTISDIKSDIKDTVNAGKSIDAKREKLTRDYNIAMARLEEEEDILNASMDVARMFEAFYQDVENEALTAIKESNRNKCTCKNNDLNKNKIVTECKVTQPERVANLSDLLDKIFGPDWTKYKNC